MREIFMWVEAFNDGTDRIEEQKYSVTDNDPPKRIIEKVDFIVSPQYEIGDKLSYDFQ